MKVAVCCIGRRENRYINEFVNHYLSIGVDKIFIYDNNYDGEEYFEDVLNENIRNNEVEIIDYRNQQYCQLKAYQDCYDKHNQEYDWILFIDCDEYLHMEGVDNIKDFLKQEKFNSFDMIHVNWMVYGDNNLVRYEDKPLKERFTEPVLPLDWIRNENVKVSENTLIKSIIRGGLNGINWSLTSHTPNSLIKCCSPSGVKIIPNSHYSSIDFKYAYLKHYNTKTIEEWLDIKTQRGFPDGNKDYFKKINVVKDFFKVNKITEEKIEYLKNIGLDYLLN